jgi:hypothetical protein
MHLSAISGAAKLQDLAGMVDNVIPYISGEDERASRSP